MPCYHPLHRLPPEYGRYLPFTPKSSGHICGNEDYKNLINYAPSHLWQDIPCGLCIGCRLEYSRQWAVRCMLEKQYHKFNEFITLTYDDEHLPVQQYLDIDTGEICSKPTLIKRDLQLFMKRLRSHFNDESIRFFACGEYGDENGRPHYHGILFGCHFDDVDFSSSDPRKIQRGDDGRYIAFSDTLDNLWDKGRACTSEVNFDTCAYVARYIVKKVKGVPAVTAKKKREEAFKKLTPESLDVLKDLGLANDTEILSQQSEFVNMSRRPGIARQYYDDHKLTMYANDNLTVSLRPGESLTLKPSRYFDKLYDLDYEDFCAEVKAQRVDVGERTPGPWRATSVRSVDDYRNIQELDKVARIRSLRRDL